MDVLKKDWFYNKSILETKKVELVKDAEISDKQRDDFLDEFGPDKLRNLSGKELLLKVFKNEENSNNLCNVLRSDAKTGCFVGAGNGDMSQWLLYYGKYKDVVSWYYGRINVIGENGIRPVTENEAIVFAQEIVNNLLIICDYIKNCNADPNVINYTRLSSMYIESFGNVSNKWFKYLAICYPKAIHRFFTDWWLDYALDIVLKINYDKKISFIEKNGLVAKFASTTELEWQYFDPMFWRYIVQEDDNVYINAIINVLNDDIPKKWKDIISILKEKNELPYIDSNPHPDEKLIEIGKKLCKGYSDNNDSKTTLFIKEFNKIRLLKSDADITVSKEINSQTIIISDDTHGLEKYQGKNTIFYGAPGCGKSNKVKKLLKAQIFNRVLFYPDYTYGEFIGQVQPIAEKGKIEYKFVEGIFTKFIKEAISNRNKQYYFVIEEINRGNAPSIFGDFFQLLDRENGVGESEYGIHNSDVSKYIYGKEQEIKLPSNLTLFATMNTCDQNVFTLDTAFKRRWSFERIPNTFDYNDNFGSYNVPIGNGISWKDFRYAINNIILEQHEGINLEDKVLGTHFVSIDDLKNKNQFAEKIFMYLWHDVAKYNRDAFFNNCKTLDELLDKVENNKPVFKDEDANNTIFINSAEENN